VILERASFFPSRSPAAAARRRLDAQKKRPAGNAGHAAMPERGTVKVMPKWVS
jgi:hypothetical protein